MDLEKLTKLVEEQGKRIEDLEEKIKDLNSSPRQINRHIVKNITFDEAFEKCKKAVQGETLYPCMYLPKSGKFKDKCCGSEAVFVDDKDENQTRIEGKVNEKFFHSLRCNTCQKKGRANSESKKKCNEKIKGIDVKSADEVNEKALSFLSGNTSDVISPSRALNKEKLPTGKEIEYDDHFHYLVPFKGNCFVFEHGKNKGGTPCLKKTPTLRGYLDSEEVEEDDYEDDMNTDIPEDLINELKKCKKFKFEGNIIKSKKEQPVVPQLKEDNDDEENEMDKSEMDKILEGLDVE